MDLPHLFEVCSRWFPKASATAQRFLISSESVSGEGVFDRILDLSQMVTQEAGLPCLLVLDEFHRLKSLPAVEDPFGRLGRKIMVQSSTMYVVASSQPQRARGILKEGLNLLFGQFELIEMGSLDPSGSLKAIRSVRPVGKVDPFLEHLLVELGQGYPGYLDLLLRGAVEGLLAQRVDDQERIVLDLLENLMLDAQGILRRRFEERFRLLPKHRNRRAWVQILAAVAGGCHRVHQIAEAVDRSDPQVVRALRVLEQTGFVTKQGVFYKVPDRLFRLWMLTAHPVLQNEGLIDPAQNRARFRDLAWSWITKVRQALHRPPEEQVLDLIRQWGGEQVEMEDRRILLPKFKRISPLEGVLDRPVIVAHREGKPGKSWLVIPWSGSLEEGQARQIVQEVSPMPFKECRKILVGAHPIEINARLVLQEARIRVWDLNRLNDLLDLYGLARIPLPAGPWSLLASTIPIGPAEAASPAVAPTPGSDTLREQQI